MTKTREVFTTPVGRIVQGDPFEPQTKDQQGNLRVYKSGPNVGQPNPQYFIALAFPKLDPDGQPSREFATFYGLLDRVARTEWPTLFPTPGQPCVNPLFTFKVKDGDGIDRNGKSNATKEGFAGHWIVSFASGYAPKVVRPKVPNPVNPEDWEPITVGPKRGHYARVSGSVTGNDSPNTPGLYLNLDMIEWKAIGPEIVSGPDAAGAFGATAGPAALPAGAQALPAYTPNPTQAAFAGPAATPGVAPPPPAVAPAAPPAAVGPQMTPLANGQPYASFVAAGWTDAQLIAGGYMLAPVAPPAAPVAGPPTAPPNPGYTGYMGVPGATPGAPPVPLAGPASVAVPPSHPGTPAVPSAPAATTFPSSGPVMTALANGQTRDQFIAAGWTDALLIEHGYMTAA